MLCLTWLVKGMLFGYIAQFFPLIAFRKNFTQANCYRKLYSLGEILLLSKKDNGTQQGYSLIVQEHSYIRKKVIWPG